MNGFKLLLIAMLFVVAGCASKKGTTTGDGADGMGAGGDGTSSYGTSLDGDGSASALNDPQKAALMNDNVIYFAYDSAEIDGPSLEIIKRHGSYLASNPNARVRLEGHTDERGSREYNIGLGERRAVSVQSVLMVQGAMADQLVVVSFGEERPAVLGSDESAYSQNRRVEIVYDN
jgi:peptidoglycan-associated lipoprotein